MRMKQQLSYLQKWRTVISKIVANDNTHKAILAQNVNCYTCVSEYGRFKPIAVLFCKHC